VAPFGLLGDERLARLAAAGHARAFGVVYERYHQPLYRYCRSILRNDADAQDALQSTFAAAFAALGRGQPDAPIRPWLFRIAHNEAVSALRRRRPTAALSAASDQSTTSVEDQVAERAEVDVLLRDLRELNERQRSALVMRELSGLSHEEIAIALGASVGAAKQTIYEARRSLFEFGEGRAMACDDIRRMVSDADGRLLRSRRVRAHLRECAGCAAFAAAIPERTRELRALVPTLPAVAAAGLLERAAGLGSGHGAGLGPGHGAGHGLAGLATGACGKAAGTALAANALAGVAAVATATLGVTIGIDKLVHAGAGRPAAPLAAPAIAPAASHAVRSPYTGQTVPGPGTRATTMRGRAATRSTSASPSGSAGAAGTASRSLAGRSTPVSGAAARHGAGAALGGGSRPVEHGAGAAKSPPSYGPPPWAGSGGHPAGSSAGGPGTNAANSHPSHGPPPWTGSGGHPAGSTARGPGTNAANSHPSHAAPPWAGSGRSSPSSANGGRSAPPSANGQALGSAGQNPGGGGHDTGAKSPSTAALAAPRAASQAATPPDVTPPAAVGAPSTEPPGQSTSAAAPGHNNS
jgi:RNA polymerase sigma factor (sigma-70 family)